MAISGGDGSIILTTKVDQKGLKSGLKSMTSLVTKSFAVIGAAAATATVAITKMAVSAYADYEQLVGGVETLFKGSAQKVIDYANDAFYTAGVSANEYMQQVTSFSASLIRSTAGDTDKAADIANMALIDISDNVNKLGSSMESVTLAYQGFAKQQYMLLDNLKLGYGGTKTEMERLLKDAQALTGVKYDINNLADVYSAIHAIQEELGITGTTAKEAEKTITGSANMMKAAWQNVLSAIAGGGDLDRAINNLVYSIQKYFENIVPVVQRSLIGIGRFIEQVAPLLIQNVASALIQSIPSLINAIFQMIIGLAKGIWQGIKALFTGGSGSVTADIKTSVGGIATEAGNASTGMEELGDATEKAGKQAKKSLAAFDDLNILSSGAGGEAEKTSEISTGSIGGGGIDVDTSSLTEAENEVGGFASVIQEQFAKIAESAKKIWNSEPVQVFVNAIEEIIGGMSAFVLMRWESIKTNTELTWNGISGYVGITISNMSDLWTTFWQDVDEATSRWGIKISTSIDSLLNTIYTTTFLPIITTLSSLWAGFTSGVLSSWDINGASLLDNIGEAFDKTILLFRQLYNDIIAPIVEPMLTKLTSLWDEHGAKWVQSISDFVFKVINGALEIYNKFVVPVVSWIVEKLSPIWTYLWDLISSVFASVVETVMNASKNILEFLGGIIDFVVGIFTGDWKRAWQGVKDIFAGLKGFFSSIWQGIKNIFSSVSSWFGEVFSNAWEAIKSKFANWGSFFGGLWSNVKQAFASVSSWFSDKFSNAWTSVKNVFSSWSYFFGGLWDTIKNKFSSVGTSIANAISNSVKSGINGIISMIENTINNAIRLINGAIVLINKIPGVNVNTVSSLYIPRLAQGAVIPPNREFLAVLGDQKHGTNIEAPAELIKQMAKEAIQEAGYSGNQTTREEHYYLDETELMKIVYKLVKGGERLNGSSLLNGGAY